METNDWPRFETEAEAVTMRADERTVDHDHDFAGDSESVPDTLSDEHEDRLQMQQLREMTVEPGLMRLPVSTVTTAKNSNQWVVEVDHPVLGTLRTYHEKPIDGWSEEYRIVRMLNWYGIVNDDPHELQLMHIYVEQSDDAEQPHGWQVTKPPYYDPIPAPQREQLAAKAAWLRAAPGRLRIRVNEMGAPLVGVWFGLFVVTMGATLLPTPPALSRPVVVLVFFLFASIVGAMILEESR